MVDKSLYHSAIKDKMQKYGLPDQKKYPMPDKKHVISAIKFFNYVDPAHEKELAKNILKRIKEYGMSFDDFGVGEDNRFSKYLPKEDHLEHHGILGQKWGVRRFQNEDGSLTQEGLDRYRRLEDAISYVDRKSEEFYDKSLKYKQSYYRKDDALKALQRSLGEDGIKKLTQIEVATIRDWVNQTESDYRESKRYDELSLDYVDRGKELRFLRNNFDDSRRYGALDKWLDEFNIDLDLRIDEITRR